MAHELVDYTLHVAAIDGRYQVHTMCLLNGETEATPLEAKAIGYFVIVGQMLRAGQLDPSQVRNQGHALYRIVLEGERGRHFAQAAALARANDQGLRVVLSFRHTPELHEIPWEILHDGRQFIGLSAHTPIVRYVRGESAVSAGSVAGPLRVLFTSASPAGLAALDVAGEAASLRDSVAKLKGAAVVDVLADVSLEKLHHTLARAQFTNRPYHLWHHAGHGDMRDGVFSLGLAGAGGAADWQPIAAFEPIIAACPSLLMSILNVCHGGSADGMAAALARLNVPYVVGYRSAVLDRHALEFTREFYALLGTASPETAVNLVRSRLYSEAPDAPRSPWTLPVLYARTQRAAGPLARPASSPADSTKTPSLPATPPAMPPVSIRMGNVTVRGTMTQVGSMTIGDGPVAPPTSGVSIEAESFDVGALNQIGSITISHEDAQDALRTLKHIIGRSDEETS